VAQLNLLSLEWGGEEEREEERERRRRVELSRDPSDPVCTESSSSRARAVCWSSLGTKEPRDERPLVGPTVLLCNSPSTTARKNLLDLSTTSVHTPPSL